MIKTYVVWKIKEKEDKYFVFLQKLILYLKIYQNRSDDLIKNA